jgi:AraC-like DNA-binding protein
MGGFSTSGIPEREQFEGWSHEIARRFGSGTITERPKDPFAATIETTSLGHVFVNDISAQPVLVTNNVEVELFNVGVMIEGHGVIAQKGRESRFGPGDLILCDCRTPYRIRFDGPFRQSVLSFERGRLLARLPEAERRTAMRVDGRVGAGRVARAFLDALGEQEPFLGATRNALAECAVDLVALAFGAEALREGPASPGNERFLLDRIKAFIEAHLSEPQLSPQLVAARHGISRRYLYSLFESQGETVAGYIWQRRLERCRAALTDAGNRHRTLAEIAFFWGFNDASHFCRAFQRRFGMSPRNYRRAHLTKS